MCTFALAYLKNGDMDMKSLTTVVALLYRNIAGTISRLMRGGRLHVLHDEPAQVGFLSYASQVRTFLF